MKITRNRSKSIARTVCAAVLTLAGIGEVRHSEGCGFESGFAWHLVPEVYVMALYNDGSGDALYVGGSFDTANGQTVNGIAKWNGTAWAPLSGPSGIGVEDDMHILAMTVYDDGNGEALYVGGFFTTAGGIDANYIAKWDGNSWSALSGPSANGLNYGVSTLAVYGGSLYVGGRFTMAGGLPADRMAIWNGSSWSAPPQVSGFEGTMTGVHELLAWNGALYVGGHFDMVEGVQANNIAIWNGLSWSAVASSASDPGVDGYVSAMAVFDDGNGEALYAGGSFDTAGSETVNHIAKWNGTSWSALSGPSGTGVGNLYYPSVNALFVYNDGSGNALYAGGAFGTAGGEWVNHIAKWDGTTWSGLHGPNETGVSQSGSVQALISYQSGGDVPLYVGGSFNFAGGTMSQHIAKWSCGATIFTNGFESGFPSDWSDTEG